MSCSHFSDMTYSELITLENTTRLNAAERRRRQCSWEDQSYLYVRSVQHPTVCCLTKRQILLGSALIVNNFKLPQELIYILVKLQNPTLKFLDLRAVNIRQYHIDCLKIANMLWGGRKDTGPALHIASLMIKLNNRVLFLTKPLFKTTILSKNPHVNECQHIQRNRKIKSEVMTSWRNLMGGEDHGDGVTYIPTQLDRHIDGDPSDYEYSGSDIDDDDFNATDFWDPDDLLT